MLDNTIVMLLIFESSHMQPTIKLIAELSGVSRGTVDRVLNNRPKVHPDKKERVLKVIRELNYKPNLAARALVMNRKSLKLGVVLPNWKGHFEQEVTRGIEDAWEEMKVYGVELAIEKCPSDLPDDFVECVNRLVQKDVKGLAICASDSVAVREKIEEVTASGVPVVTYNSDLPTSGRVCFVGQDLYQSGRIAASLMNKLVTPTEKILVAAGNLEFTAHRQRVDGFLACWKERGKNENTYSIIQTFNEYNITFDKLHTALEDTDITGIYMANESVNACAEAVKRSGRQGVRIIAHDLSDVNTKLLKECKLDFIISQNMYLQGYDPIEILTQLLTDPSSQVNEYKHTRIEIILEENIE